MYIVIGYARMYIDTTMYDNERVAISYCKYVRRGCDFLMHANIS